MIHVLHIEYRNACIFTSLLYFDVIIFTLYIISLFLYECMYAVACRHCILFTPHMLYLKIAQYIISYYLYLLYSVYQMLFVYFISYILYYA